VASRVYVTRYQFPDDSAEKNGYVDEPGAGWGFLTPPRWFDSRLQHECQIPAGRGGSHRLQTTAQHRPKYRGQAVLTVATSSGPTTVPAFVFDTTFEIVIARSAGDCHSTTVTLCSNSAELWIDHDDGSTTNPFTRSRKSSTRTTTTNVLPAPRAVSRSCPSTFPPKLRALSTGESDYTAPRQSITSRGSLVPSSRETNYGATGRGAQSRYQIGPQPIGQFDTMPGHRAEQTPNSKRSKSTPTIGIRARARNQHYRAW